MTEEQMYKKIESLLDMNERLLNTCQQLQLERNLMARLASDRPQFYDPFAMADAKQLRDDILEHMGLPT